MYAIAKAVKPVMKKLFPDVPAEHPAMGAMMLNISANMLGLGNAATPFGIKAMVELNRLNPLPGTATNAMCLFLAINTSSVTLLPLGVIGVRAAAESARPADIFLPTLIATIASTIVGISIALFLAKLDKRYKEVANQAQNKTTPLKQTKEENLQQEDYSHLLSKPSLFFSAASYLVLIAFFGAIVYQSTQNASFFSKDFISFWLMPFLMLLIITYGMKRGVKVYEAVTEGAKQGFEIAIRIIPYLVAILVAIAMFRASGAMELLISLLEPITGLIHLPAEALPMALLRPLSGSGAFGVMSALVEQAPDSYTAFVASTMMGSTETTFYVLAVYFGAVNITKIRHALVAALLADATGIVASCLAAHWYWTSV